MHLAGLALGAAWCLAPTDTQPLAAPAHVECRTACTSRASAWLPARRAGAARWMRRKKPRWDWGARLFKDGVGPALPMARIGCLDIPHESGWKQPAFLAALAMKLLRCCVLGGE